MGILIGRNDTVRALLDPFLQWMRPIPVTAWLPLSMILFGLGARSAFFLVFLGAFYPILLNTVFGVRDDLVMSYQPQPAGSFPDGYALSGKVPEAYSRVDFDLILARA